MFNKIIEKILRKNRTFIAYMERVEYLESRVANEYKEIKDRVANDYEETKDIIETLVKLNNLKRK